MARRACHKLSFRFFGPFKIIARVNNVAYKLQLPEQAQIHPVFHVSQLKKHVGNKSIPGPKLPFVNADGTLKTGPAEVLQVHRVPRQNVPVVQWLIRWIDLPARTISRSFSAQLHMRGAGIQQLYEDTSKLKGSNGRTEVVVVFL